MPAMRKDSFPAIEPKLYGGRVNHLRRELLLAFEHGALYTGSAQPITDWLSTALAFGAEYMGTEFSGGGGAQVPATANGILLDAIEFPSVAEGGTFTLPGLTTHNYVNGIEIGSVTVAWSVLPAGTLPDMDGAVSIAGTTVTGVTEGTAAVTLSLSSGGSGAGNVTITYVYGITVTA